MNVTCNRDCFNCPYSDCIVDDISQDEYREINERDNEIKLQNLPVSDNKRQQAIKAKTRKRAYYDANIDKLTTYYKKRREDNKDKIRALRKIHYEANKERSLVRQREYHENNKERRNAQRREHYKANAEQQKAYQKAYYRANRQQILEQKKAMYAVNKQRADTITGIRI